MKGAAPVQRRPLLMLVASESHRISYHEKETE